MKWLTIKPVGLVGLASAWLITRFVDQEAKIIFAAEADFDRIFGETSAIPFEVPGVEFSSGNTQTSFSILLTSYRFTNQALRNLNKLISSTDQSLLESAFKQAGLSDQWNTLIQFKADTDLPTPIIHAFDALYRTLIPASNEVTPKV